MTSEIEEAVEDAASDPSDFFDDFDGEEVDVIGAIQELVETGDARLDAVLAGIARVSDSVQSQVQQQEELLELLGEQRSAGVIAWPPTRSPSDKPLFDANEVDKLLGTFQSGVTEFDFRAGTVETPTRTEDLSDDLNNIGADSVRSITIIGTAPFQWYLPERDTGQFVASEQVVTITGQAVEKLKIKSEFNTPGRIIASTSRKPVEQFGLGDVSLQLVASSSENEDPDAQPTVGDEYERISWTNISEMYQDETADEDTVFAGNFNSFGLHINNDDNSTTLELNVRAANLVNFGNLDVFPDLEFVDIPGWTSDSPKTVAAGETVTFDIDFPWGVLLFRARAADSGQTVDFQATLNGVSE